MLSPATDAMRLMNEKNNINIKTGLCVRKKFMPEKQLLKNGSSFSSSPGTAGILIKNNSEKNAIANVARSIMNTASIPANARIVVASAGLNRLRPVRSSLTQREWEVADLLVEGAATTEIAGQLQVSPATVRTHVKHILRKLGMHSQDEAIRYVEHLRRASGA
jgi:DNA-binding NarL/FixJ family response regulator